MSLHPDDPRLTSYLLGELSAAENAEIEQAALTDPAILQALQELEQIQLILADTLVAAPDALLPHQRDAIRHSARQSGPTVVPDPWVARLNALKPWLIPLSAAAIVMLGVYGLSLLPGSSGPTIAIKDPPAVPVSLLPAPGPADANTPTSVAPLSPSAVVALRQAAEQADARDLALATAGQEILRNASTCLQQSPLPPIASLPALTPRDPVSALTSPTLPLPIQSGRSSLRWVAQSVRGDHKLPPPNAVRLEEILNAFALKPNAQAAVAEGVSISTESVPCPWRPSATLLIVTIRGATDSSRDVSPTFHADPKAVANYRLLGYANMAAAKPGPLPSKLPAKSTTTLAIEIEPSAPRPALGSIAWTIDGKPAAAIPVVQNPGTRPSDDARFASLVCAYSQWLACDRSSPVDKELLAALAREINSPKLPPDRADFLKLIDQTLRLANEPPK